MTMPRSGLRRGERPAVSVIIPTYNRPAGAGMALASLSRQAFDLNRLEAIVVDDGSDEDYPALTEGGWPFAVEQLRLENGGPSRARNAGAARSGGDVLVFMDDDITLTPRVLERLVAGVEHAEKTIVLGTLVSCPPNPDAPFAARMLARERAAQAAERAGARDGLVEIPFAHCLTGLLAVRRADFEMLGMFQDPTGGWPNWDDVDFGYRAHRAGFALVRHTAALAEHHDFALGDLATYCDRMRRAGRAAVRLFERHPDLRRHLPMFRAMPPLDWRRDPPGLVARKLLRLATATAVGRAAAMALARGLERAAPGSRALDAAYRWAIGAFICLGFQEGMIGA